MGYSHSSAESDRRRERIRDRAYQLWEAAGKPTGRDKEFWFRAERESDGDDWQLVCAFPPVFVRV